MKVSDIMWTDVTAVHEDSTIADAVLLLADEHITGLPVVDGIGKLVGVLSATDVLNAVAEAHEPDVRARLFDRTMVSELMTPSPRTITPDADIKDAAQQMLYLEIHRLFVVDHGELVGIISQSDIVRAVATAKTEH
jgi:CBS domain-containing protein